MTDPTPQNSSPSGKVAAKPTEGVLPDLTREQLAFLRFHAEGAKPHYWKWTSHTGRNVAAESHPDDVLVASKRKGSGVVSCRIYRDQLAGLAPYWRPGFALQSVNDAGLALLAMNPTEIA